MIDHQTICAPATASGGAISIIRISGEDAIKNVSQIFSPYQAQEELTVKKGYTLSFGTITDRQQIIDEVLVSIFKKPHSYTGENSVEISCHGSSYIVQRILELLIKNGCRLALPGEFTQRAFLNKKMDLSQAEAVADLIASSSEATHKLAMNQMRGGFSKELSDLRNQLLHFTAMIELELDFSEEDVQFANRSQLNDLANKIYTQIGELSLSFQIGNALKNGIPVAIVGETNAGKSTLLNLLLNEDKAIVSDIHGTTRDVIEDTAQLKGINYRFIDTAGLRQTSDQIENLGIERTYKKIEQASIVLWMIDSTQINEHIEWMAGKIVPRVESKRLILVFNKIENINEEELEIVDNLFSDIDAPKIHISAKQKLNIDKLVDILIEESQIPNIEQKDLIITNVRHYEALNNAQTALRRVINGIQSNISGDFISQDIRECIHYLGEITGEISSNEVLETVFKNFCIGK